MNRIIETRGRCSLGELLARWQLQVVVGFPAICPPVPFVCAGVGIKDDNAAVEVSIGHEELICLPVYEKTGRSTKILRVVAALVLSRMSDLKDELSFVRKLQNLIVLFRVSAQPH